MSFVSALRTIQDCDWSVLFAREAHWKVFRRALTSCVSLVSAGLLTYGSAMEKRSHCLQYGGGAWSYHYNRFRMWRSKWLSSFFDGCLQERQSRTQQHFRWFLRRYWRVQYACSLYPSFDERGFRALNTLCDYLSLLEEPHSIQLQCQISDFEVEQQDCVILWVRN